MKLNFDFNLPDNARVVISGNTTSLVVTLCVPKTFAGIRFPNEYPIVHRGAKRFFIRKERVLTHLNGSMLSQTYLRMVRDLQITARQMKRELLTNDIKQLHLMLI